MNHFYESLPGWFTFPKLYEEMAKRFPNGAFAEIGVYAGRSFAYLGVELENLGGAYSMLGVDNFGFISTDQFDGNMKPLDGKYHIANGNSCDVADHYPDGYFDFIMIDANHEYAPVKTDILAWLPKVRIGGVLAGHDVGTDEYRPWPGVIQAVREVFGNSFICREDCWVVEVGGEKK